MEKYYLILSVSIGLGLVVAGYIWMLIEARNTGIWWYIGVAFLYFIIAPIFAYKYRKKGFQPLIISIIGFIFLIIYYKIN